MHVNLPYIEQDSGLSIITFLYGGSFFVSSVDTLIPGLMERHPPKHGTKVRFVVRVPT